MSKYMKIKKRIFQIIQIGNREDIPSRVFDMVLVAAIVINISALVILTFDPPKVLQNILTVIDIVTLILFTIEYLLRIWTANLLYPAHSRFGAILRFLVSFDGIVDILTIAPFSFLSGMSAFRLFRVVRIFHLFKVNQTYDSFNVITTVLYKKRKQLLSSIFIIAMLILASSLCMYTVEKEAQPGVFKNAFSGLWWSVSTILTIGYGDIYPVTMIGRFLGILIGILGVGVVAIPTGILSAGFVEQHSKLETDGEKAPKVKVPQTSKIIPEDENLIERLLRDRANTDPETRKLFDQYLAEILRD